MSWYQSLSFSGLSLLHLLSRSKGNHFQLWFHHVTLFLRALNDCFVLHLNPILVPIINLSCHYSPANSSPQQAFLLEFLSYFISFIFFLCQISCSFPVLQYCLIQGPIFLCSFFDTILQLGLLWPNTIIQCVMFTVALVLRHWSLKAI